MATETQSPHSDLAAQIETRLHALMLEEQVALLAGANMWATVPIEWVGLPLNG